ncbi:MAG: hypothetical protein ABMA64_30315, partial [Myxococcota bacterium]
MRWKGLLTAVWAGVATAALPGGDGASAAAPNVPVPWDRIVDALDAADTMFLALGVASTAGGEIHADPIGPGNLYLRVAEDSRFAADIEGIARVTFDGTQLWFDNPNPRVPPQRLAALEPIVRDLVPFLRAGMPGSTWRVLTGPEPGMPPSVVHDAKWAEVGLPFAWAAATRVYVRVNGDGSLMTIRVIDAATNERYWLDSNHFYYSEINSRGSYWDVVLEPDLDVRTYRGLHSQGYPEWVTHPRPSEGALLYHQRIVRLPLSYQDLLSTGTQESYGERPALEVGPVVCAGPAPVVQLPFTFVFAPDPAD